MAERAVTFACAGECLVGILHTPDQAATELGILIVVGGPQYRVGSHRQFVLMARAFAAAGFTTLRFDYRGMGDSSGEPRTFESVDMDVAAAIDELMKQQPSLRGVVIVGLCDAASAALMYCRQDPRLRGLMLMNPWVRTESGAAKATVRHYYGQRLLMKSFWLKVLRGEFQMFAAARSFIASLLAARRKPSASSSELHFTERMLAGLQGFRRERLFLLSDRDLTAREFEDLCQASPDWRRGLGSQGVRVARIDDADHTFSSRRALDAATTCAIEWLRTLRA